MTYIVVNENRGDCNAPQTKTWDKQNYHIFFTFHIMFHIGFPLSVWSLTFLWSLLLQTFYGNWGRLEPPVVSLDEPTHNIHITVVNRNAANLQFLSRFPGRICSRFWWNLPCKNGYNICVWHLQKANSGQSGHLLHQVHHPDLHSLTLHLVDVILGDTGLKWQ